MGPTIAFDATAAVHQGAGIGRYTRELLAGLAQHDDSFQYKLFYWKHGRTDGRLPDLDDRFRVRAFPLSDRVANAAWHRLRLPVPLQLLVGRFDLFHSPDFTVPPVVRKPTVLTIHDLAFLTEPECAYPTLRAYLEKVVPRSARRADHIIAVSEQTRRDVIDRIGISPERVTTVLEGVLPSFRPPHDREMAWRELWEQGIREPFILSVGVLEPRKNYVRLLEAYALLRGRGTKERLVIAGRRGWLFEPVFQRLRELDLADHVTFIQPDDDMLVTLYGLAEVFVFPSLYEGFGIPPLEAMACGAPVVCSRTSSLPEIVGDAAIMCDPRSVESIAGSLARVLGDDELRQQLRRRSVERASGFSWKKCAQETLRVYRDVLARA